MNKSDIKIGDIVLVSGTISTFHPIFVPDPEYFDNKFVSNLRCKVIWKNSEQLFFKSDYLKGKVIVSNKNTIVELADIKIKTHKFKTFGDTEFYLYDDIILDNDVNLKNINFILYYSDGMKYLMKDEVDKLIGNISNPKYRINDYVRNRKSKIMGKISVIENNTCYIKNKDGDPIPVDTDDWIKF